MSASRTKKERQTAAMSGLTQKEKKDLLEAKKHHRNVIIYTIIGIVAALCVAALLIWDSGLIQRHTTAFSVGDKDYGVVDLDYYYYSTYATYASYADSYGLDTSAPLDEQEIYEGYTWDQMLRDSAIQYISNVSVLYQEAMNDNFELSQDGKDTVTTTMMNASSYASLYGVSESYYLQANYGKYMTQKEYERILTEYQIASEYAVSKGTSFEVTEDQIQTYYGEHTSDLDTIDYNCYLVSFDTNEQDADGNTVDLDEATVEANRAAAETQAQEILDALVDGDADKAAQLAETYGATDDSNMSGISSSGFADWMSDSSHGSGSYDLVENISASTDNLIGYFAIYVNDRYLDDYNGVDVRVMRLACAADEDGNYDMDTLTTEADTVESTYTSGDMTAESFGELADTYSTDAGTYEGGLRETVSKKAYNDEITAWLFDADRQEGDFVRFLDADNNTIYFFYFVGENDTPYWKSIATTNVQSELYDAWLDEVTPNYETANGFGMRFVG